MAKLVQVLLDLVDSWYPTAIHTQVCTVNVTSKRTRNKCNQIRYVLNGSQPPTGIAHHPLQHILLNLLKNFDQARNILDAVIQKPQFSTSDHKSYSLHILPGEELSLDKFRDRDDFDDYTRVLLFQQLLDQVMEKYDYIFVDVAPTNEILTQCVLNSCDTILTPVDYSKKSLHHAVYVYQEIVPKTRRVRTQKSLLRIGPWNLGLVFSNCPLDTGILLENRIQKELNDLIFTGKQCKTRLKAYAQTKIAEFERVPVICWQNSPITKLYSDLANEVFLTHNFVDH